MVVGVLRSMQHGFMCVCARARKVFVGILGSFEVCGFHVLGISCITFLSGLCGLLVLMESLLHSLDNLINNDSVWAHPFN